MPIATGVLSFHRPLAGRVALVGSNYQAGWVCHGAARARTALA